MRCSEREALTTTPSAYGADWAKAMQGTSASSGRAMIRVNMRTPFAGSPRPRRLHCRSRTNGKTCATPLAPTIASRNRPPQPHFEAGQSAGIRARAADSGIVLQSPENRIAFPWGKLHSGTVTRPYSAYRCGGSTGYPVRSGRDPCFPFNTRRLKAARAPT